MDCVDDRAFKLIYHVFQMLVHIFESRVGGFDLETRGEMRGPRWGNSCRVSLNTSSIYERKPICQKS